jgi:hypothetical protein
MGILQIMKILKLKLLNRKSTGLLSAGGAVLFVMLLASIAFGDEIDDSLPPDAPQAVKASAREAIQSGLNQEKVVGLTRTMLQHRFQGQQIQAAHALMIQAHNSGMPVEPLMNKAFEGMAKGVDPSLIVGAMEKVQARHSLAYRHAAQISGNKSRAANLGRELSAAMAAGFLNEDADRITRMIRQRTQVLQPEEVYNLALECFYTARDVSRLGVSSQAVANMLAGALGKGFNYQNMRAMRYAFMHQARQSEPQKLAHRFAASIQEGKGFQNGPGSGGEGAGGPGHGRDSSGGPGPGSGGSNGPGPGHGKN